MDEARESSYDPTLLATNVSTRHIPLSAIRDAASAIYDAAIRTPLIRLELPDAAPGRPAGTAVRRGRRSAAITPYR